MAETAPAAAAQPPASATTASSPKVAKKKRAAPKPKSSFNVMDEIRQMVAGVQTTKGLSVVAIKKALEAKGYKANSHMYQVKSSLSRLKDKGVLIQIKGNGATGSYKINKQTTAKKPAPRKKQSAANKPSPRKKLAVKKPHSAKRSTVVKRVSKAKSPAAKKIQKSGGPKKTSPTKKPVKKVMAKKAAKNPLALPRKGKKTVKGRATAAKKTPAKKK